MYHYSSPPPGWSAYDYAPPPSAQHFPQYYSGHPSYTTPHTPPRAKRHAYRASYSAAKDGAAGWYPSSPGYPAWQNYYEGVPDYASPPRKHEHVSASFGGRSYKIPSDWWQNRYFHNTHEQPYPFGDYDIHDDEDEDEEHNGPFVFGPSHRSHRRPAAPPYADPVFDAFDSSDEDGMPSRYPNEHHSHYFSTSRHFHPTSRFRPTAHHTRRKSKPSHTTDHYFYSTQVPLADDVDSPKRSRARRASTSTRLPPKPKPTSSPMKPAPRATEEDAIRAGIPAGYSIKNWDPTEAPILLLGSAFDSNTLGKWIYDWTIYHYGATAPMADVAGELWLLLIRLAGKVKRADECAHLIRFPEAREMVEGFLESGERLWARFKKLIKACEHFMWKAAKRESGKGSVTMGRNSGCEFVDSIFGRDRELENTEKLMNSIRLWNMRFDANCDDILKRPDRA